MFKFKPKIKNDAYDAAMAETIKYFAVVVIWVIVAGVIMWVIF